MIVQELISKLGFKTDQSKIDKANRGFEGLKKNLLLVAGVATGAAIAINKAIQPAVNLQDSMRDALILTGETGEAFKQLDEDMTDAAKNLSDKLGVSAEEVAVGFYQVLSTGAEAMSPRFKSVAETAIKFGKTIGMDVAQSVERINDTLSAFQLKGTQAEHVADVFFTTSKLAALTVPQLADAMRDAAPTAATLGISLEETAAILATLADKGLKGARAGTAFRMMMVKLAKPTAEGEKELKKMGLRIFDNAGKMRDIIDIFKDMKVATEGMSEQQTAIALKAIVGEEAFSKLAAILGSNLDKTNEWTQALRESEGALDLAFVQRMDTAKRTMVAFKESLKTLMAEGVEPFLGDITQTFKDINEVIHAVRQWINANRELVDTLRIIYSELERFSPTKYFRVPWDIAKDIVKRLGVEEREIGVRLKRTPRDPSLTGGLGATGMIPAVSPGVQAQAAMMQGARIRQENRFEINIEAPPGANADELARLAEEGVENLIGRMNRTAFGANEAGEL